MRTRAAGYVGKRLAFALLTVLVAVTVNFALFRAAPGDATTALRCRSCTPEFKAELRQELGLDHSLPRQYLIYLGGLAHGDLGRSFEDRQPVLHDLKTPIVNTLPMVGLGTLFAVCLGTLTGVVSAWRRGTFLDWGGLNGSLLFYSLPTQWLGMMLLVFFAGYLPASGVSDPFLSLTDPGIWTVLVDRLKHMVLPSATLGLVLYGEYALIVRSSLLETLGEDYVLTARAKGLRNWSIVWRHGLRNAMLPVITLVALSFGFLIAGAILVETVFSYPGIGLATYDAVLAKDYPVVQGSFLLLTFSVILANLVADLLYFKLDPRITE